MKATRQRGQVLVLFALALTVFIGAAALTVDFGFWLSEKRALQNAADAAAQAGISALLKRPITAAKRDAAADHAMLYLNDQLGLGLAPGEVHAAAAYARNDADGFGSEDGTSYRGSDHFFIATPVTAAVSCHGGAYGNRAITVRIQHLSSRFFSQLIASGPQGVAACATSAIIGGGLAVAVLQPNQGVQPNSTNITMKLAGADAYVRIWGGDVGINSMFSTGSNPPPNSPNDPAFVKFMTTNETGYSDNRMLVTIEDPSPITWSVNAKQIRAEGVSEVTGDDVYHAPVDLPGYIPIPGWGDALYVALAAADAFTTPTTLSSAPTSGPCDDPLTGSPGVAPGKYDLISLGTGERLWLCPGVFHFVKKNGQQGLSLASNSTVAGQGVTLVFESDSSLRPDSGSQLLLNSSEAGGTPVTAPWRTGDSVHDVPITVWIHPVSGCDPDASTVCSNSSNVFDMQGGAGMSVRGIIYGPTDNMKIAGNDQHHGSGEIWAWTLEYKGNSQLDQLYEGADDGYPLLVE
jgi:hypothetical protein